MTFTSPALPPLSAAARSPSPMAATALLCPSYPLLPWRPWPSSAAQSSPPPPLFPLLLFPCSTVPSFPPPLSVPSSHAVGSPPPLPRDRHLLCPSPSPLLPVPLTILLFCISCIEYNSKIYMICVMDDLWLAYLPEHTRFDMMPFFLLICHPSLEHLVFLIAI